MADYQDRLLSFVKRAEQASQAAKERAVRAEGLTTAQYNALLVLRHQPGITAAELARHCAVTAQTMSSVLGRLVARELVSRTSHPRHRSILELSITSAGRSLFERADARVEAVEAQLAGAFRPAEREALRQLLARVTAAAERADPGLEQAPGDAG